MTEHQIERFIDCLWWMMDAFAARDHRFGFEDERSARHDMAEILREVFGDKKVGVDGEAKR